jgi:excisionase family DNA binding protein
MSQQSMANGGNPAAAGGQWRRQIAVNGGKNRQMAATYSVAAAARELGIPERTLREWIRLQKIEAAPPRPGKRGVRISAATLGELQQTRPGEEVAPRSIPMEQSGLAADGGNSRQMAADGNPWRQQPAAVDESEHCREVSHDVSPHAAILAAVERERDLALRELEFVKAQLERRAEEAQRQATAEEQLRVMLMQLERTNAELAGALLQKALPPHEEPPARRLKWWQLWRRP